MAGVKHRFVDALPDLPADIAAGKVLPSHWNQEHDIDSLQLPTAEATFWDITSYSSDYGTYFDNTFQIGYNCSEGTRDDLTDIAWYLQWESKFLSGSDYIAEFHLNYIGVDGTQRRLLNFDVDRATHETSGGLVVNSFYINNDAQDQIFQLNANGRIGINFPSPVATLDVQQVDDTNPGLTVRAVSSVALGQPLFDVFGYTGARIASLTGGLEYEGRLNLTSPTAQTNGPGLFLSAGSGPVKTGSFGLESSGITSLFSNDHFWQNFYKYGVFFYNSAAGNHLDLQLWQGEIIMNSTPVFTGDTSNGQSLKVKALTELLTVANTATSTTTIQKPAGSIILSVSVRVTTAVTCTTSFTVGDSTSASRFSTAAVPKGAGNTDKGTKAGAYYNATAEGIVITPDTTPSDSTGRVRVTIHYIESVPAAS